MGPSQGSDRKDSMNTMEMPFSIGETFWQARHTPYQETVPCPICSGRKTVTVLIGDDEAVRVACDACGLGYEGPQGTITEWSWTPGAVPFVISGIAVLRGEEWTVRASDERCEEFLALYRTEAEALAESLKRCDENTANNMRRRYHWKKGLSKAAWTVRYHQGQIRDLERQLAWHRSRISVSRPSEPKATAQ